MKLFFEVLQDGWNVGIGYRIIISIMITSLLVTMCSFIYECGLFIFIIVLPVAMVYWLIDFILKRKRGNLWK